MVGSVFTDKFSLTGLYDGLGAWRISGIIDRSIIEVFLNGSEYVGTSVFFPTEPFDRMNISVEGIDARASSIIQIWGLRAAWLEQADANGVVVGNVSARN